MRQSIALKNNLPLQIEMAHPQDAEAILAYLKQVGSETEFLTFGSEGINLTVEEEARYLGQMQDPKMGLYLLGTIGGKIAGTLSLQRVYRPRLAHIGEFGVSVLSEYWGLGICHALLGSMIAWARMAGLRKINLRVHEKNDRAVRIYEKFGFIHEGARARAFASQGQFYSEFMMGLVID